MANIISTIKPNTNEYAIRSGYTYYGTTTGTSSALKVTITDDTGTTINIPELTKGLTLILKLHVTPTASATLAVNSFTAKSIKYGNDAGGANWEINNTYVFVYNGTNFVAISTYDDYVVTTTGSGNAITKIEKNGKTITATKGSTFLTGHPSITTNTDTTSAQTVTHSGTFTVVDSVTRDGNGHVTKVNTKTITLPGDNDSHYTSKNIVGASASAKENATATNGNVYLNHLEQTTVKSSHKIVGDGATTVTSDANGNIKITSTDTNTDTKNTAGSTNTSKKIYLIGAESQAANPQTYSHDTAYVGTDGCLYSNSTKVSVEGHTHDYAPSTHTHDYAGSSSPGGSATSANKLATARTIAISGGATGTATEFNGTANISIPVTGISEAYLTWGGKNHTGSYGPIDAAMIPELGANRMAFTPADKITVEYSKNGGTSWSAYSTNNTTKVGLFTNNTGSYIIGGDSSTYVDKSNYMVRVTVNTKNCIYSVLNKFMIYCSTNNSTGSYCTILARLQQNVESNTETWKTFADKIALSGWSGYNIINTSGITTYGNRVADQYGQLRFVFGVTSHSSSSQYAGLTIYGIKGFGGVGWTTPSTLAKTGHLYSYDVSGNATFPGQINTYGDISLSNSSDTTPKLRFVRKTKTDDYYDYYLYSKTNGSTSNLIFGYSSNGTDYDISTFDTSGNYSGNAATATTASKLGTADKGSATNPIYLVKGVPTACTYSLEANVPSNAVFTDTNTKVTSAANHYSPSTDTSSALSVDASSNTAATWGTTQLVTGVNISRDSKGHVTGLSVDSIKMPSNPNTNTHYTSKNIVGASASATGNATATNGNVYLNHLEEGTITSKHKIVGDGATKVTSDANGNITISSTDTNTTYSVATASADGLMSKDDKSKLNGIAAGATANTGTVTSITPGTGLTGASSDAAITTSGTINLKTASDSEIGGIKIGYTQSGKNYPVVLDSNNKAYVNVPWTDTDTNTHYTSKNVVGASESATGNATATNGSVYLNHVENGSVTSKHKIVGNGATKVTSDDNGNITIESPTIPTIPSVGNGKITIKQGSQTLGSFTMNQAANATINIPSSNSSNSVAVVGLYNSSEFGDVINISSSTDAITEIYGIYVDTQISEMKITPNDGCTIRLLLTLESSLSGMEFRITSGVSDYISPNLCCINSAYGGVIIEAMNFGGRVLISSASQNG